MAFSVDVLSLKRFYSSNLGNVVASTISDALSDSWSDIKNDDDIIALGFTVPYLGYLDKSCKNIVPVMPSSQGAMYWPARKANRTVLARDCEIPLPKHSCNRALICHSLEHSRNQNKMLKEVWEILVPGGKMLIAVPNRRSFWSQAANTPFGCGQPFSINQLKSLIKKTGFTICKSRTILFGLPFNNRILLKTFPILEILGRMFFPAFGGILIMEIEKQIYSSIPEPSGYAVDEVIYGRPKGAISPKLQDN